MWLGLLQSQNLLSVLAAYIAGLTTFFASCLLPLVPIYLTYLTGIGLEVSEEETAEKKKRRYSRTNLLPIAGSFVLGFIVMFVVLGVIAGRLAISFGPYRIWLDRLGGLFLIAMGLFLADFWQHSILQREWRLPFNTYFKHHQRVNAFLTGLVFALGWTPCIGPILAVILFWIAQSSTAWLGFGLLLAFGTGLGTPFMIMSLAFDQLLPYFRKMNGVGRHIRRITGVLLVISGFLLLNNQWGRLAILFLSKLGRSTLTL